MGLIHTVTTRPLEALWGTTAHCLREQLLEAGTARRPAAYLRQRTANTNHLRIA
jgi:hypothetical protein